MKNLFLTGEIGVGKSTLLKKLIEKINTSIGGYVTERVIDNNTLKYNLISLYDGTEEYTISKMPLNGCSNDIEIFLSSFNEGIFSVLEKSFHERNAIIMDELGFMESKAYKFKDIVLKLLDSSNTVIGVLKKRDCEFLNSIRNRNDVVILEVTKENRDCLLEELLAILNKFEVPLKKESAFYWSKELIQFYDEAISYKKCEYIKTIIDEIKKYVPNLKDKTLLDVGSGIGAFSIPLSKEVKHITAVDSSFNMLNFFRKKAKAKEIHNIDFILSPFEKDNIPPHDITLSIHGGGATSEESLFSFYNLIVHYGFIAIPTSHNFNGEILYKMLDRPIRKFNISDTLENLQLLNCKYEHKELKYNFPQFFKNYDDALKFFKEHFKIQSKSEICILKEFINKYIYKYEDGYLFDNIKTSSFIVINKT
ncbi:MAG: methyltransferase domain-containing protein [Clostridium argentinense]|uniref:Methyltransferase domain-containing protein n=1 Tax=Clostridium faecium TaxID=2762223 RepID=A0ABR8YWF1_9CLOT|nr:nucleoside-triphosphatase [Clostridium faecium]MBD8048598.1 methyltransferase domain-containing protein [Clostridium faecium]MBS5823411.1 methyltransferase domain-containing protein [Clostridium argentinense]